MNIDEIQDSLLEMRVMMIEHGKDLKEHIRRTELLEDHVTVLNTELVKLKTLFMVIGWLGAGLGIVGGPLIQWWLVR